MLFILVDAPPDLQPTESDIKTQARWELENTAGGAFIWDRDHGRFNYDESGPTMHEALHERMEGINKCLGEGLIKSSYQVSSFEVRPVRAVRI